MGEYADYTIDCMIEMGLNPKRIMRGRPPKAPACPVCGGQTRALHTQFGWRRDCCDLWGWGKYAPLASAETHQARSYARKVFDSLWQSGLVSRSRAYGLLAAEMGIDPKTCHMKLMDRETAERVPFAVHIISKRLRGI